MRIYNSLTKKIEDFKALDGKTVRMYSCGPTVYDNIHIGNLFSFIAADSLRRALEADGLDVKHAMNLTDIDDKTIKAALEKYPDDQPLKALQRLTDEYIEIFKRDMAEIGNDIDKLEFIRATDCIEEMKQFITKLHSGGFAYTADDGVYFSIEKYRKSGKKYGQLLELTEQNTSGGRISNDEYDKDSAHDFALWKKQKDGEPAWEFEIEGHDLTGRPGWHIECSVMSAGELDLPFDIHTGGVDLIFPHHENEIAQSTAMTESPVYAQVFAHNEHLLVDSHKMSKSLNNFYTLSDIKKKGFNPLAFRLMFLQGHYRNQLNFTNAGLTAAQNRLHDLQAWADLAWQPEGQDYEFDDERKQITGFMIDDVNTPQALATISHIVSSGARGPKMKEFLEFLDSCFALGLSTRPDISDDQKAILKQRQEVRDNNDWDASDKFRDKLKEQGITVKDTGSSQIWSRFV